MSETDKQVTTEHEMMDHNATDPALSAIEVKDLPADDETQTLQPWQKNGSGKDGNVFYAGAHSHPARNETQIEEAEEANETQIKETQIEEAEEASEPQAAIAEPATKATSKKSRNKSAPPAKRAKNAPPTKRTKQDEAYVHMLLERCRHLCISLFYREHAPVRSVGFTSSIGGEGKSFFASTTAQVLAQDSRRPVTLIECNWEHPTLHKFFDIPMTPGLAEWLRGSCDEDEIRYQVDRNLTVIPAGIGSNDAVKLLNHIKETGLHRVFKHKNELYIVDLPSIITTGYGSLAASLLEALVIVVRAQVIQEGMIVETCSQLNESAIHGIVLNQVESHIPGWLRHLL